MCISALFYDSDSNSLDRYQQVPDMLTVISFLETNFWKNILCTNHEPDSQKNSRNFTIELSSNVNVSSIGAKIFTKVFLFRKLCFVCCSDLGDTISTVFRPLMRWSFRHNSAAAIFSNPVTVEVEKRLFVVALGETQKTNFVFEADCTFGSTFCFSHYYQLDFNSDHCNISHNLDWRAISAV